MNTTNSYVSKTMTDSTSDRSRASRFTRASDADSTSDRPRASRSTRASDADVSQSKSSSRFTNASDVDVSQPKPFSRFTRASDADVSQYKSSSRFTKASDASSTSDRPRTSKESKNKKENSMLSEKRLVVPHCNDIDVCFIVDCTHSMQPHITEIGFRICDIVNRLKSLTRGSKLRMAFVGYYDYYNDCDQYDLFVYDFTTDYHIFSDYIKKIETVTGFDAAEDVIGGLNTSTKLNWRSGNKLVFHFADAPGHGWGTTKFSSCAISRFPRGHPLDVPYKDVFNIFKKMNVLYTFGKINNDCDKMITDFSKILHVNVIDAHDPQDLSDSICSTISNTISGTNPVTKTITAVPITQNISDYTDAQAIRYAVRDNDLNTVTTHEMSIKVKMLNLIDEGAFKKAFHGKAIVNNRKVDIVIKSPKSARTNIEQLFEIEVKVISLAGILAGSFNIRLKEMANWKIKFLESYLVKTPNNVYILEKPIDTKSYKKFTNNYAYVDVNDPYIDLITAFSHWTYAMTQKKYMIVDLQGIVSDEFSTIVLTDPAVHSFMQECGSADFGERGFQKFFSHHKCSAYCEYLDISHIRL